MNGLFEYFFPVLGLLASIVALLYLGKWILAVVRQAKEAELYVCLFKKFLFIAMLVGILDKGFTYVALGLKGDALVSIIGSLAGLVLISVESNREQELKDTLTNER